MMVRELLESMSDDGQRTANDDCGASSIFHGRLLCAQLFTSSYSFILLFFMIFYCIFSCWCSIHAACSPYKWTQLLFHSWITHYIVYLLGCLSCCQLMAFNCLILFLWWCVLWPTTCYVACPISALEAMVNYAYTGCVSIDQQNVQSLLIGASFLSLTDVREACSNFFKDRYMVDIPLPCSMY